MVTSILLRRNRASGAGASMGDSMHKREENSVRVTNLSEDTREDDLRVRLLHLLLSPLSFIAIAIIPPINDCRSDSQAGRRLADCPWERSAGSQICSTSWPTTSCF